MLENEYLGRSLVSCPSPPSPVGHRDHVGVHPQHDGKVYVGIAPTVGRVSGTLLVQLADLMERYAVAGARLTPYQKIVLVGVDPAVLDDLLDDLDAIGLSARPSAWRQNTMACTGIEFCKLAIVDTKNRARDLVAELERRFPGPRRPDHGQRQRLPQRLRPHPGRRHRSQGPAGHGRRPAGRGVPGAPGRRHRSRGQLRPQAARAQGDQRRTRRLRHHRGLELPRRPHGRRVVRDLGRARRRGAVAQATRSWSRPIWRPSS